MNLLGKILVLLIAIMSIVYMGFAVVVYSTHRNWRDQVENPQTGLKQQVGQLQNEKNELTAANDRLSQELVTETDRLKAEVGKLSQQRNLLEQERSTLDAELQRLKQEEGRLVALQAATAAEQQRLRNEVDANRDAIRDSQLKRDEALAESVALSDQLNQATAELERLKATNARIASELSNFEIVLQNLRVNPYTTDEAPRVDGLITAVNAKDLVELNLGSDDGLKVGHTLDVIRNERYIARVRVVKVSPNVAVAQVVKDFKLAPIQKEDRVASRLY
jgi:predicted nuclease with TOPRIM domain